MAQSIKMSLTPEQERTVNEFLESQAVVKTVIPELNVFYRSYLRKTKAADGTWGVNSVYDTIFAMGIHEGRVVVRYRRTEYPARVIAGTSYATGSRTMTHGVELPPEHVSLNCVQYVVEHGITHIPREVMVGDCRYSVGFTPVYYRDCQFEAALRAEKDKPAPSLVWDVHPTRWGGTEPKVYRDTLGSFLRQHIDPDISDLEIERRCNMVWEKIGKVLVEPDVEVFTGTDIVDAYVTQPHGFPDSCMTGGRAEEGHVDLYSVAPCSLLMTHTPLACARALVWHTPNGYHFLDRIYSEGDYECGMASVLQGKARDLWPGIICNETEYSNLISTEGLNPDDFIMRDIELPEPYKLPYMDRIQYLTVDHDPPTISIIPPYAAQIGRHCTDYEYGGEFVDNEYMGTCSICETRGNVENEGCNLYQDGDWVCDGCVRSGAVVYLRQQEYYALCDDVTWSDVESDYIMNDNVVDCDYHGEPMDVDNADYVDSLGVYVHSDYHHEWVAETFRHRGHPLPDAVVQILVDELF